MILLLVALPVIMPVMELLQTPAAWHIWSEGNRLADLALQTITIALTSSLLAVITGFITAVLLVRTQLKWRRGWSILIALALVVPLPMLLSGWYLVLQTLGAPLAALWPIETRWAGTVLLHALFGLPWVIVILSLGLAWVEPALEEEMLLYAPMRRVLMHVVLPRCWPFIGMALLVASWPTWHEISVTDYFKISTLAEEVYLQLTAGGMDETSRALAAIFPWCIVMVLITMAWMHRWQQIIPHQWPSLSRQQRLPLLGWQIAAQVWMLLILVLLLGVPLWGLVQRVGMVYSDTPHWSWIAGWNRLWHILTVQHALVSHSLAVALGTGLLTTLSAMLLLWLTRSSMIFHRGVWWLMAILWAMPGPLLGLGLLSLIQLLIQLPGGSWLSPWLYSAPSPVPNIWVCTLRFLPLAWLALWPIARQIPQYLEEAAWLEGASPWQRFQLHFWPRLWKPGLAIMLGTALLALGEISASKLVTTPGYLPLSHHVFQQLHAGADTEVAALSLVLLMPGFAVLAGLLLLWKSPGR